MPAMEQMDRNQKAVLLARIGSDDYDAPVVSTATELDVRWVQTKTQGIDPQGNTIAYDVSAVVDREIAIDSIMWLGTLEAFNALSDYTDLYQVSNMRIAPSIKGKYKRYTAQLMRYQNKLPKISS